MISHSNFRRAIMISAISIVLASCGLQTPEKRPFVSDSPDSIYKFSEQGSYESGLVDHITCEISRALAQTDDRWKYDWLKEKWGTSVTLTLTVEDQSGVTPGLSVIQPLQNALIPFPTGTVVNPQSFSFGFGATASANALRTETIQYTFKNSDAIAAKECHNTGRGNLIEGDLKISQFIFDKAQIINAGNGLWDPKKTAPYNAWTEEITFVTAFGATATPTWKLARVSANTSSNLLIAERTDTNDLIITLGPLDPCQQKPLPKGGCPPGVANGPLELIASAMNQHNARVAANAIAVSVTGQSH